MRGRFLLTISLITTVDCYAAELSKTTTALLEQVEKERHLAMIGADISSVRAREISAIGSLTYYHRTCGESIISAETVAHSQAEEEQGFNIDHGLMAEQASLYADKLQVALAGISPADHDTLCEQAKSWR